VKAGTKFAGRGTSQRGFTLVEMLVATLIVIVGLVAVAQLVPTSVLLNSNNRNDGTALVFAQRQMEALREQPLNLFTFNDPVGVTCPIATICNLGSPALPRQPVGSPLVVNPNSGTLVIDFSAAKVSGYSFTYTDPNDPYKSPYDVRWAVFTVVNGQLITGKRIIVGVFRPGMQTLTLPITLDTMVEK
jgi:prepilin-type N-terminal cleavage/methylation domain-containing protein